MEENDAAEQVACIGLLTIERFLTGVNAWIRHRCLAINYLLKQYVFGDVILKQSRV